MTFPDTEQASYTQRACHPFPQFVIDALLPVLPATPLNALAEPAAHVLLCRQPSPYHE
jgi:hypothetical protein